MAETVFKFLEQKIEINDIVDIIVTEIEEDPAGGFVRELRFTGSLSSALSGEPRSLVLRVKGITKDNILVQTPQLTF